LSVLDVSDTVVSVVFGVVSTFFEVFASLILRRFLNKVHKRGLTIRKINIKREINDAPFVPTVMAIVLVSSVLALGGSTCLCKASNTQLVGSEPGVNPNSYIAFLNQ
jgi:hypothetical protein